MATYHLKPDTPQKYASYKWKAPVVFVSFISIAIACSNSQSFWEQRYPQLPNIPSLLFPIAVIGAIFSFGLMFAAHYALQGVMNFKITLTTSGVFRSGSPQGDLFLPREEIIGFTEGKNGIVLRTADSMRWIQIFRDTERYEEIRSELADMGITRISHEEDNRSWDWVLIGCGSFLVLAVIAISRHGSVQEGAYVVGWLLVLAGLAHLAWRGRLTERKTWYLLARLLFVAGGITLLLARHSDQISQRFYLEVFCLSVIILCVIFLVEWRLRRWKN